jgi:hypothetical protein
MVTYRVPGFEYTSIHDALFDRARDSGFDMELFRLIENIVVYEVEARSVFPALNIPQMCCLAEYVLWQQVCMCARGNLSTLSPKLQKTILLRGFLWR